jgi:hypothetical protein
MEEGKVVTLKLSKFGGSDVYVHNEDEEPILDPDRDDSNFVAWFMALTDYCVC